MLTLKLDEVVVTTAIAIGVVAADCRTRLINRAASLVCVKESTDAPVYLVLLMTKNALLFGVPAKKLLFGSIETHIKVLRESFDVAVLRLNSVIGAAVARAFAAVIFDFLFSHGVVRVACPSLGKSEGVSMVQASGVL